MKADAANGSLVLRPPGWVEEIAPPGDVYPTPEDRMRLAVRLSRENVRRGTGGPFGAAVFEGEKGRLVAAGVNMVVPTGCSVLHAEIVAITLAQQALGSFDLGASGLPAHQLVASTEPCAMCFGATPWSGVSGLLCGARDSDARAVGFDEGAKMEHWAEALEERGIAVARDVLRGEAAAVLREYAIGGGRIYNGSPGGDPR